MKLTRRVRNLLIDANPTHLRQPSLKDEAYAIARSQNISFDAAFDAVLARRRDEARQVADDAKTRRPDRVPVDPTAATRAHAELNAARIEKKQIAADRSRNEMRDLVVLRAEAFAAFVVIAESKGLPAHVIDERRLAAIAVEARWDLIPLVLAWLIREDDEVKRAYHVFADAAKRCMENLRTGANKASKHANEIISEKYREMFLHAASAYARKLSTLEASLDRLSALSFDELESLVADGDDLSKRLASISVKISDEIKRRDAQKGASAKSQKLDPVREYAVQLANEKTYPSRRQAVLSIKDRVLIYANSLDGISMSSDQAFTTIDGWLKKAGYTPSASKQGTSTG